MIDRDSAEGPRVFPPPDEGMVALHAVLEGLGLSWDEISEEDQAKLLAAAEAASEE